jgi:hypothetical protein
MIGAGVSIWKQSLVKALPYNENFEAMFELDAFSGLSTTGVNVNSWTPTRASRSGVSFNAGTNKPVLADVAGTPVVRFAGGVFDPLVANAAGNNIGLDFTDQWTFFALVRQAIGSNGTWMRIGTGSNLRIAGAYDSPNRRLTSTLRKNSAGPDSFITLGVNSTPSPQDWQLYTGKYDGTGGTGLRVGWNNRTKQVNTTTPWTGAFTASAITAGHFYIGSADGTTTISDVGIDIAFMGLYRHAFTDAEQGLFADWLESIYGVTIS